MQIVIGWTETGIEVVRSRRTDLGERPVTREVTIPKSCMWLNDGTTDDLAKARAYAASEGKRVFTYNGNADPLNAAKHDALHP